MHICMSNDVIFYIVLLFHFIFAVHTFSFKHGMLNFPDGINKVFELD